MKKKFLRAWSGLGVYIMGICGVLFGKYLPELLRTQDISSVVLTWPTVSECIIAIPLALVAVALSDNERNLTPEEKAAARAGKIKRIKRRFVHAFLYGMGSLYLLKTFLEKWVQ